LEKQKEQLESFWDRISDEETGLLTKTGAKLEEGGSALAKFLDNAIDKTEDMVEKIKNRFDDDTRKTMG